MSPRLGPPPLLLLLLCWLMLRPVVLGFPVRGGAASRRELSKSASGDDLISGSDFLSVFIGASITPRSGRARQLASREKIAEDPDQSISSFGERTIPRHRNTLSASDSETKAPDKSEIERFEDLSSSDNPKVELVSLHSENTDKNPLSISSSHVVNNQDSDSEYQSEIIASSSRENVQSSPDSSQSNASSEDSSEDTQVLHSTVPSTIEDEEGNSEFHTTTPFGNESDITIVTDIVTSQEELLSQTESSLSVSEVQGSHEHKTGESNISLHTETSDEHNLETYNKRHKYVDPNPIDKESKSTLLVSISPSPSNSQQNGEAGPENVSTTFSQFSSVPTESTRVSVSSHSDTNSRPQNPPVQQVISVRVSSSVVQGPSPVPYLSRSKNTRTEHVKVIPKPYRDILSQPGDTPASEEDIQRETDKDFSSNESHPETSIDVPNTQFVSTSLVTEDQPAATAVQRSQLSVEEASPSSSEVSAHRHVSSNLQDKIIATVVETTRDPHRSPVSYHTSISSATSGSRIRFYSEPSNYHRGPSSVAETIQTSVVRPHQGSASAPHYEKMSGIPLTDTKEVPIETSMGRYGEPHRDVRISSPSLHRHSSFSISSHPHSANHQIKNSREQKSFQRHHQEPVEKNYEVPEQSYVQPERTYGTPERTYGTPERAYGVPERNYEVDEAVSVMTHGRAHGLQPTTPAADKPRLLVTPRRQQDKFGYVEEGLNYRRYQVEERTPDGFIVGEYGVVSHDDGNLRGVRYTADGTINPQVIYDALAKFLSL